MSAREFGPGVGDVDRPRVTGVGSVIKNISVARLAAISRVKRSTVDRTKVFSNISMFYVPTGVVHDLRAAICCGKLDHKIIEWY